MYRVNLPRVTPVKVILVTRPQSILEHYIVLESFAAVRDSFGNSYLDREVPNMITIQLATKFRDTGSVYL
jgi:hypothetical protein